MIHVLAAGKAEFVADAWIVGLKGIVISSAKLISVYHVNCRVEDLALAELGELLLECRQIVLRSLRQIARCDKLKGYFVVVLECRRSSASFRCNLALATF